jgi:hypothetical protein
MPLLHAFEQELLAAAAPRKMQGVWALNGTPNRGRWFLGAADGRPRLRTRPPATRYGSSRLARCKGSIAQQPPRL